MKNVEIDFVVPDSLEALALYERIFEIVRIEVTSLKRGENEAVFSIFNTRFHLLDENAGFGLFAPLPDSVKSVWFNVTVPDIETVYAKAMQAGCAEIQPVTPVPDLGISNAMFSDPFGYIWMLHQIHREVSLEERMKSFEQKTKAE